MTSAVEYWGRSWGTAHPWPLAAAGAHVSPGAWVFNLAGFVVLCLTFPDGRLPGRRWAAVPWAYLGVALLTVAAVVLDPVQYRDGGGTLPGATPLPWPRPVWIVLDVVLGLAYLAVLGAAVASLVVRYRRGGGRPREQLRWLALGAGSVLVLLPAGWVLQSFVGTLGYAGFLVAVLVLMPAAVTVAILRHDLLDVDRLLSSSVAWVLTTVTSAALFAGVVLLMSEAVGRRTAGGATLAAFVTALALLPLHRQVTGAVARVLDRERAVMLGSVRAFVQQVRDGGSPERVEAVLGSALGDDGLRLLLRVPGGDGWVDLAGAPVPVPPEAETVIPLEAQGSQVAALVLGRGGARQVRRVRAAAVEARLPIEVARLQTQLRTALADVSDSRARLVEGVALERRRLERDLHDGAQQRIIAVGLRLRSLQRRLPAGGPDEEDLDAAVAVLEETVGELRRLAHGVRPGRLDDGLDVALRELVAACPVPVELAVDDVDADETLVTTAYFVVAECLANALKHACARRVRIDVAQAGGRLRVGVSDDGRGGALSRPGGGFGLTAMRDRVAAVGGRLEIASPVGGGTTVTAEL